MNLKEQTDVLEWLYYILRKTIQYKSSTFTQFYVETNCNGCGDRESKKLFFNLYIAIFFASQDVAMNKSS